MKSSTFPLVLATATALLAGCASLGPDRFASRDRKVEYLRVFDIRTDAPADTVARAASDGMSRNVVNATLSTPQTAAVPLQDRPMGFRMAAPVPVCDGASWAARAAPQVRGGRDMHLVACLFPYRQGYHLDMYVAFTRPEGGWLEWPRRLTGMVVGTPEKWTEKAMLDIVRAIRAGTRAEVALVQARPQVGGEWLEVTSGSLVPVPAAVPGAATTSPVPQPPPPSPVSSQAAQAAVPAG